MNRYTGNKVTSKLVKIKEMAEIMDKSLKEEMGGFLTYYTEEIIKLTTKKRTRINTPVMDKKKELELELYKINKWEEFERSFKYFMENSPEFRKKAHKIISKLFIKKHDAILGEKE